MARASAPEESIILHPSEALIATLHWPQISAAETITAASLFAIESTQWLPTFPEHLLKDLQLLLLV
jgi:hypothetical protein